MGIYLLTDIGMRVVRAWSTEQAAIELTRRGDEAVWQRLITQNEFSGGFAKFLSNYRDLSVSRDFVSSTYLLAIADLPFFLLYLLAIGLIAWPMVIVSAILVIIYAVAGGFLQYKTNQLAKDVEKKNTQKLSYMSDMLGALEVVKTVPKAQYFLRNWRELSDNTATAEGKRRLISGHSSTLAAGMMTFSSVAMLVAGVYLIDARALSVGGLIACNLLSSRAMSLVTSLFMIVGKWQDFQRATKRMESAIAPVKAREYTSRQSIVGNISIIKLTKQYPERPTALDAVSFEIKPGERVALLGKPGAGKSTLLKCIAGLNKQDSGQILMDGLSLDDIVNSDKAKWLAWKSQDPAIFAGTLEENLLIAGSTVGSEQFLRAIWASGLEDELKSGRITLGMKIDERGANLSGGQRQKIALARAFAQPSQLLLLDEPTLGLDPESEHLLAERLPQILKPESVLVMTTHSAIMLNVAQRVIALDGGRIIADGPRDKLVRVG
jgi:ATP-binding cassette subfamily B protein/ATP-binding cassette subfamily C protein LapB